MKLSSCINIISGGTPDTKNDLYWNGNIPWISIKDFNNNRYIYTTEKNITENGLKNSATNLLNKNDIIISARGTVGCLAQLTKPMAFNQSCYGIRSNKNNLLQNYLYYWLVANIHKFKKNVHGAVFDTITKDTFDSINIEIPPLDIQQHIIDIIGSIDDKIENNSKITKKLKEQSSILHQKYINKCNDKMVNITDIAEVRYGKSVPTKEILQKGKYPIYGSNGIIGYLNDFMFEKQMIAISCRGNSSGIIHLTEPSATITSNSLYLIFKSTDYTLYFYNEFMKKGLYEFRTGSAQPQITIDNLNKLNLIIPNDINEYNKIFFERNNYINYLVNENKKLRELKQLYLKKFFG